MTRKERSLHSKMIDFLIISSIKLLKNEIFFLQNVHWNWINEKLNNWFFLLICAYNFFGLHNKVK